MFKDLIRQKEHMVLPDLAQDLAQVRLSSSSTFLQTTQPEYSIILRLDFLLAAPREPCFNHAVSSCMLQISTHKHLCYDDHMQSIEQLLVRDLRDSVFVSCLSSAPTMHAQAGPISQTDSDVCIASVHTTDERQQALVYGCILSTCNPHKTELLHGPHCNDNHDHSHQIKSVNQPNNL